MSCCSAFYSCYTLLLLCIGSGGSEHLRSWMRCQTSIVLDGVELLEYYWSCTHPGKWTVFIYTPDFCFVDGGQAFAELGDELLSTGFPPSVLLLQQQCLYGWSSLCKWKPLRMLIVGGGGGVNH